jgi:hypothetical protein
VESVVVAEFAVADLCPNQFYALSEYIPIPVEKQTALFEQLVD